MIGQPNSLLLFFPLHGRLTVQIVSTFGSKCGMDQSITLYGSVKPSHTCNDFLNWPPQEDKLAVSIKVSRASLVAQWLGICLPMQGTRVRALVWEDPTCRGATGPVSHNY